MQAWDSGAASIHLLTGETCVLSSLVSDYPIQQGHAHLLQSIRDPAGQDIIVPTLSQWLCAAVVTVYAEPVEIVVFLGNWCAMEEGVTLVQQMGVALVLITGSIPNRVAVTISIKMQLLREVPATKTPRYTSSRNTGNVGACQIPGGKWCL